jgi:hypothetical protein
LDQTEEGDSVEIAAGTYEEAPIVSTPNTSISGKSKAATIIDGGEATETFRLRAAGLSLARLTVLNGDTGIRSVRPADGLKVVDVRVGGEASLNGIDVDGDDVLFDGLLVAGHPGLCVFVSGHRLSVLNSRLANCDGLRVEGDDVLVEASTIRYAVANLTGDGAAARGNVLYQASFGVTGDNAVVEGNEARLSSLAVRGANPRLSENIARGAVAIPALYAQGNNAEVVHNRASRMDTGIFIGCGIKGDLECDGGKVMHNVVRHVEVGVEAWAPLGGRVKVSRNVLSDCSSDCFEVNGDDIVAIKNWVDGTFYPIWP